MGALEEVQAAIGAVAASVGPSVVGVGGGWGQGSGIVLGPGKVLTNAHNVHGEQVTVVFADGRTAAAEVAGLDLDGDLAVLSVDTGDAPAIIGADGVAGFDAEGLGVAPGTVVFALANRGGRGLRVTMGLVSSVGRSFRGPRGRRIAGSIEHTAPMAHGSSGGPIVDGTGRLLGINTNRVGEGFYQALPWDRDVYNRVTALSEGEEPYRPHLGLGIVPGHAARRIRHAVGLPERDGLLVRVVEDGSAAAAAGLATGDYIVAAAGTSVASVEDLWKAMEPLAPSTSLDLTVVRGAEERTVTVTLPPRDETAPEAPAEA